MHPARSRLTEHMASTPIGTSLCLSARPPCRQRTMSNIDHDSTSVYTLFPPLREAEVILSLQNDPQNRPPA